MEDDEDYLFGECEPIGEPIFVDLDGKKFYSAIVVHNVTAKYGDCVRVNLEPEDNGLLGEADEGVDNSGYGQIFAIYDDPNPDTGVMVEIRWFSTPEEFVYESVGRQKRM